jgi:hypothetical protein
MRLEWNPRAVLTVEGGIDINGATIKDPEYDPRWEVWDTSPDGMDYMVMRVQTVDGEFRPVGDWLVHHIGMLNPEKWGGDVGAMVTALIDDPTALQEAGTEKDSDDLIDAATKWATWAATPKSGAVLDYRGKRPLSA